MRIWGNWRWFQVGDFAFGRSPWFVSSMSPLLLLGWWALTLSNQSVLAAFDLSKGWTMLGDSMWLLTGSPEQVLTIFSMFSFPTIEMAYTTLSFFAPNFTSPPCAFHQNIPIHCLHSLSLHCSWFGVFTIEEATHDNVDIVRARGDTLPERIVGSTTFAGASSPHTFSQSVMLTGVPGWSWL